MLLRALAPALLAMAGLVHAQSFSDLAACGQTCINSMDTTVGCVPVTSECLCSNVNFIYGIRDCADTSCSAADASAAVNYASSSCASVLAPSSAAVPTPTEATSTSETPTPTEAATTSSDAATTASSSTVAEGTSAATTSSDASTTATETAASETTASSGTAAGTSSQTTGAASASSASASGASSGSGEVAPGLSSGTKAGIVVGAAGAAVAVVALVMYFSRKRSQPLPRGTMKISEPLPGSGRIGDDVWDQYHQPQFSPPPPRTAGSNMSELDRHARPYDEMVPRMTPHRMV